MKKNCWLLSFLVLFLPCCTNPNAWKKIAVSGIEAPLLVKRFEQDFFALDTSTFDASEAKLRQTYGGFYNDYTRGIMGFGQPVSREDTNKRDPQVDIRQFLSNPSDRSLFDTVQHRFRDFSGIQKELQEALRHFRYYFPEKKMPNTVYTFISEFANGAITYGDTVWGIGLDMYLGEKYPTYDAVGFPDFMKRKLDARYLVPNAVEVLYNNYYDQTARNAELPLIDAMLNEGKKLYFMECLMPEAPDSILIGYTRAQEQWCQKSQKNIWQFFSEQDLLYKVNFMEQKRYISDGPTTPGMPPESPGRVGSWLGWQIVRKYMRDNGGAVSLRNLLEKKSTKEIFKRANYKPK